jgi:hypothetical protein
VSVPAGASGNFCTNFNRLSQLPRIPAADRHNPAALRQDLQRILTSSAADLDAAAGGVPPRVASALHTLAGIYRTDAAGLSSASSAQIEHEVMTGHYTGAALAALHEISLYYVAHCT